jgi:hypothetical protein
MLLGSFDPPPTIPIVPYCLTRFWLSLHPLLRLKAWQVAEQFSKTLSENMATLINASSRSAPLAHPNIATPENTPHTG